MFIPSVLVLATYILGSAAAARIFTGLRRIVAIIGLVLLSITVPFAGRHLLVPVIVAVIVIIIIRRQKDAKARAIPCEAADPVGGGDRGS